MLRKCFAEFLLTQRELLHESRPASYEATVEELRNHKHPSSKKDPATKKFLTLQERRLELSEHYKYAHGVY